MSIDTISKIEKDEQFSNIIRITHTDGSTVSYRETRDKTMQAGFVYQCTHEQFQIGFFVVWLFMPYSQGGFPTILKIEEA